MAQGNTTDFATLLDELIAERGDGEATMARTARFDHLSVADQLAGVVGIAEDAAIASYLDVERELDEILADVPIEEPMPPTDQPSIAAELALTPRMGSDELDRIRREFALRNHPDRVSEARRDGAIVRMQIANMLIDEAKRRVMAH